ncbi:uncharacterized protein B0T15DRAFT_494066 [Chaetomium strumarium]|uniref:Uncharacterized protein n=1 Tax=Chaetomium strumarium TaxID=1170767 RepID=A0AAJ0GTL3_9PEZI|nr:hypothetical protein B0T15DRAFT_494066 [Chaetomium strumarium]
MGTDTSQTSDTNATNQEGTVHAKDLRDTVPKTDDRSEEDVSSIATPVSRNTSLDFISSPTTPLTLSPSDVAYPGPGEALPTSDFETTNGEYARDNANNFNGDQLAYVLREWEANDNYYMTFPANDGFQSPKLVWIAYTTSHYEGIAYGKPKRAAATLANPAMKRFAMSIPDNPRPLPEPVSNDYAIMPGLDDYGIERSAEYDNDDYVDSENDEWDGDLPDVADRGRVDGIEKDAALSEWDESDGVVDEGLEEVDITAPPLSGRLADDTSEP